LCGNCKRITILALQNQPSLAICINMCNAITNLINTYHELNAAVVDQLDDEPSALEFMRYVANNRPFVVRGAATQWAAVKDWSAYGLLERVSGEFVRVAVTPLG
jgi:peptidyl-lysine (3S)-dioxygenase / protease